MSSKRVAVVTGANKGIGLATVRALCREFDGDVILTSRDEGRGKEAVTKLQKEGINPLYHQLDITDPASIQSLKDFLVQTYGGLDVLVNNAGIAFNPDDETVPYAKQAEETIAVNFTATLNVCRTLFPILRPHARVVNVSSRLSERAFKSLSPELQSMMKDKDFTMEELETLMQEFVKAAKKDEVRERGWYDSAFGVSKVGVTVMSFIQAKELKQDSRPGIIVNTCCPGFVATSLTNFRGTKTPDEGADTPVYLSLLPPNTTSPVGEFVSNRTVQAWG